MVSSKKEMADCNTRNGLERSLCINSTLASASSRLSGLRLLKLLTKMLCTWRGCDWRLNATNPIKGFATNNKAANERNNLNAVSRDIFILNEWNYAKLMVITNKDLV